MLGATHMNSIAVRVKKVIHDMHIHGTSICKCVFVWYRYMRLPIVYIGKVSRLPRVMYTFNMGSI